MKSIHLTSIFTWGLRLIEVMLLVIYELVIIEFEAFGLFNEFFVPWGVIWMIGTLFILIGVIRSWSLQNNGGGLWMIVGSIISSCALFEIQSNWWFLLVPGLGIPFMITGILVLLDSWVERHDPPSFDGIEGGWGSKDARPSHIFHDELN